MRKFNYYLALALIGAVGAIVYRHLGFAPAIVIALLLDCFLWLIDGLYDRKDNP